MRLHFTKMQGAGNDFVVLDATAKPLTLTPELLRRLADRRFGVGADQILLVERSRRPGVEFRYRVYNGGSGQEVEHCGNGARCLLSFLHQQGLTRQPAVRIETINNLIELRMQPDGRVTVDMNRPVFEPGSLPFDGHGLQAQESKGWALWPLQLDTASGPVTVQLALLSMGNPHAVQRVDDVDSAPVETLGPLIATHARFPRGVNAGFLQVAARDRVRLRVYERGAGETLACGTGACAAVVAGIRLGWLDAKVEVETRGGRLTIEWAGAVAGMPSAQAWSPVLMTGPAETVFVGDIEL